VRLGFQKSTSSTAARVKFTINLLVTPKAEYAAARREQSYLPETPSPNSQGGPGWWERIGALLGDGSDGWWYFDEHSDAEALTAFVTSLVRDAALPAMRSRLRR